MQINRGTEYAIRAALYLTLHAEDAPIPLATVAEGTGAPANYLSNILQSLTRFNIVRAHRGSRRGYSLARPPAKIDLLQILEALQGPLAIGCCTVGAEEVCPLSSGCLVTEVFRDLQDSIRERLSKTTLAKMARRSSRLGLPDSNPGDGQ